jgi:protein-S-isoprenylcysteine O-methyltransferase Ste14
VDKSQLAFFVLGNGKPEGIAAVISWLGVAILASGMIFMIGGWYSLGKYFSTDAELLDEHDVCRAGLFQYVMHPAYSGIIQCLLGASLAATSIFCALFTVLVVAPLWLNRAKYEEQLLLENLGQPYKKYGDDLKWRRLVPTIFPFGV